MWFDLAEPCLLCGRRSTRGLCRLCTGELRDGGALYDPLCRCGLPGTDGGALCGRCLRRPPPFTTTYCHWIYQFPLDRLINAYKHKGCLPAERALEPLLREQPLPWPDAEVLCPLPAHWRRRLARGFDQAERLALILARHWRRPVAPLLLRHRPTGHQQGLGRTERVRNLRHAFLARPGARYRRILLIDDVMTTGTSARAASRALLEGGAKEVRVWALARTLYQAR
ncbi:MAG: ComF family protein [Alcanivorax sp.]|jgi:ComF family protein|nr:ComF family protein [Alcanivorax sp.]